MLRRLLKRFIPSQAQLRKLKGFGFVGEQLFHPALWHLSRRSVRLAVFVGVAFVFIPIPGHVLIGAVCAVWLRCNVALTVALIWINNPLTIAPLYYFAYRLGALLLGLDVVIEDFHADFATLQAIGTPFLFGCLVLAAASGVITAMAVDIGWRLSVRRQWRTRLLGVGSDAWRAQFRARGAPAIRDAAPGPDPSVPPDARDTARQPS